MEKTVEKKPKKSISYAKWGIIFIIPFFVIYLLFSFVPQVMTLVYSFLEYRMDGMNQVGPYFVGLKQYIDIFTPTVEYNLKWYDIFNIPLMWQVLMNIRICKYFVNTLVLWVICAVPQFLVALLLAVLFTSTRLKLKFTGFFKSLFYMPNLIMASAFGLLFFGLLGAQGPIDDLFKELHINTWPLLVNMKWVSKDGTTLFLGAEIPAKVVIAGINYIMWFGNTTILLMAGIQGIDESLFESARIDGANSGRVFKDITMPLLKPIFIYSFITSMIGGIQMFDIPQIITSGTGTPNNTTKTVIMYLTEVLQAKNYGRAGAISVVLFIVTGVLSIIVFKAFGKDKE